MQLMFWARFVETDDKGITLNNGQGIVRFKAQGLNRFVKEVMKM